MDSLVGVPDLHPRLMNGKTVTRKLEYTDDHDVLSRHGDLEDEGLDILLRPTSYECAKLRVSVARRRLQELALTVASKLSQFE